MARRVVVRAPRYGLRATSPAARGDRISRALHQRRQQAGDIEGCRGLFGADNPRKGANYPFEFTSDTIRSDFTRASASSRNPAGSRGATDNPAPVAV